MTTSHGVVPLVDLSAGYERIREELLGEFDRVLGKMDLFLGESVRAFEREFASWCECPHGIGMSSGTDALYAALRACGVGPGDEVILPALTFFASTEAVIHAGATPVFADVDPDTLGLDPASVRDALSPESKAIVPVHMYGQPANMAPLLEMAHEHGLRVIEDAAQAHGARIDGRPCGSLGDAGCFSFYFTKNLGAYGEAGFVTTGDEVLAEQLRLLRNHGQTSKHQHAIVGHNFRLDELQAAVLRVKLRHLDEALERRREIAARYDEYFRGSPVRTLSTREGSLRAPHLYPVRVANRDAVASALLSLGIETGIHYREPVHLQPALQKHPHRCAALPVAERACGELLSLPLYPELTEEQLERVAQGLLQCVADAPTSTPLRSVS